ncbi:MAG: DUF892 family protein [Bryobacteraceae bacterium]
MKDLNSAENQLVTALPKVVNATSSAELKAAFATQSRGNQDSCHSHSKAFESVNEKPKAVLCKGMKGLIEEGAGTWKRTPVVYLGISFARDFGQSDKSQK